VTPAPARFSREEIGARVRDLDRRTASDPDLTPAAVALTVSAPPGSEPVVLITLRASHLDQHSGQFALPGGRMEASETPEAAARRELEEELGLSLPDSAVLGLLDDFPTRSGFRITPVVLWTWGVAPLRPHPDEVACVFGIALADLDDPAAHRFRSADHSDRPLIELHVLGTTVWAPTAAILHQFREVALRGRPTRVDRIEQPLFAWE
jgi:8-oxo-dGTP pyrophosphatase MutT (NUDIX family)